MLKIQTSKIQQVWFIFICSIGGFLLDLAGLSIGWILGSLFLASILSFWRPKWIGSKALNKKGIDVQWRLAGQCIIGIELGQKMTLSIFSIFKEDWFTIIIMLLLSIIFSLISGLILFRFSNVNLLTGLFATTPGGIVTMPGIAEEFGANTGVVSVVQMMRILLVVSIVPIILHFVGLDEISNPVIEIPASHEFNIGWTILLAVGAILGALLGKRLKIPAPWLVGSLIGVFVFCTIIELAVGQEIFPYWPQWIVIIGQVLIGAGIGSGLQRSMFTGLTRILFVSTLGTIGLIIIMFLFSYIVSKLTGISFITAVLAFAPGGVVEMATASISLHADSTFVVAVQTFRIVLVILLLPPILKIIHQRVVKKDVS